MNVRYINMDELARQLTDIKKKYEDLLVEYYEVKRQNEERAEIINDLLTILEVDSKKLRAQLERRCEDDGK